MEVTRTGHTGESSKQPQVTSDSADTLLPSVLLPHPNKGAKVCLSENIWLGVVVHTFTPSHLGGRGR